MNNNTPIGVEHDGPAPRKFKHTTPTSSISQGAPRLDKAQELAKSITLIQNSTKFFCPSQKDPSTGYHGDFEENTCECPDNQIRQAVCKHIRAAKIRHAEDQNIENAVSSEEGLKRKELLLD